jgi:hypothetical protein
MNRRSDGLVRALNEFASLTVRCGFKDVHPPAPAKVPIRIDGLSRKLCRRSSREPQRAVSSVSKKMAMTISNSENNERHEPRFLLTFRWRAYCASFFQLAKANLNSTNSVGVNATAPNRRLVHR